LTQFLFSTKQPAPAPPANQSAAPKQQRKLAVSGKNAAIGGAAGALAGFFLVAFGLPEIMGSRSAPGTVLISLVIGAAAGLLRRHWWLLAFSGLLAAMYVIVGYSPIMDSVAPRWVRADPLPAAADAIIVLSGSVLSDTALNIDGTERLLAGLELFQRGIAPRVVTTLVEIPAPEGVRSTTMDQARLIKLAGALPAWIPLEGTMTTRDEALQAASKLPVGGHRVVVVTSPIHTRRACATFETVGFTVSCYPARTRGHATWRPIDPGDRIEAFANYLYERLGMIEYRRKHWVPQSD